MAFKEDTFIESMRAKPDQKGRAAAISRLNGNEVLYIELLKMFFAEDMLGRLRSYLAKGDAKNALLVAHGMKGTSANLGLDALSELAAKVERPLRENDVAAAQKEFPKLEKEFGMINFFQK